MYQRDKQGKIWADQTIDRVSAYWSYPNFTKRAKWLAEQLKQYKFGSVFEVGLFSGRNLKIIKEAFPKIKIGGIDINGTAINFAKEKLPDAELSTCSIYDMDTSNKWDIVLTMGVMIHIPPDGIDKAVYNCFQKASKYVVHAETVGNDKIINGPAALKPSNKIKEKMQWWPNLSYRYKKLGGKIILDIRIPYYRKDHPFRLIVVEK